MAKVKFKSYIKSAHGRLGNVIYYNVNGIQYARSFTIPRNPRTAKQQHNRAAFASAVKEWQALPLKERAFCNRMAKGRPYSGYNLFISMWRRGITPSVLRLLHRKGKTNRLLPGYYPRAGNSVYHCSSPAHALINPPGCALSVKKPPGRLAAAA